MNSENNVEPNGHKSLLNALSLHLKTKISELMRIQLEFPQPSAVLTYPSVSITSLPIRMNSFLSTQTLSTIQNEDGSILVIRQNGECSIPLKLSLWCENPMQRFAVTQKIINVFAEGNPSGLNLPLPDYYKTISRCDLTGYQFDDSAGSAQRGEWRTLFDLVSSFPAIYLEKTFPIHKIKTDLLFQLDKGGP